MAQIVLDVMECSTVLQGDGGEGVPQAVRTDSPFYTGPACQPLHSPERLGAVPGFASGGDEQRPLVPRPIPSSAPLVACPQHNRHYVVDMDCSVGVAGDQTLGCTDGIPVPTPKARDSELVPEVGLVRKFPTARAGPDPR